MAICAGAGGELKSMTIGSVTDGGYAVPTELDARIAERLTAISPIRGIAQVVQTSTADYRKLISLGGTVGLGQRERRAQRHRHPLCRDHAALGRSLCQPSASQQMLDDAAFDLESWLAQEIATEFGRAEGGLRQRHRHQPAERFPPPRLPALRTPRAPSARCSIWPAVTPPRWAPRRMAC
jgi:HK97 family phage major capsid protein